MENIVENQTQEITKRGRPIGSTIFNRESFLKAAVEVYSHIFDDYGKHPSQKRIAEGLGIARTTLIRYLREFQVSWANIRQKAMQMALGTGEF